MPPKKDTSAGKGRGKEGGKGKGKDKKGKDDKDQKRASKTPKCRTPLACGTIMAQRALAPTICCPSQGATARCCLARPGCWPC